VSNVFEKLQDEMGTYRLQNRIAELERALKDKDELLGNANRTYAFEINRLESELAKYKSTVLLNCPFCDGDAVLMQEVCGDDYYVQCMICDAQSVYDNVKSEVIMSWNKRV